MEIAIIGGGAAGMITAYLLDGAHRVTVYERQPILGGNIRTLGRNVACPQLPAGVHLDAGVIEFSPEHFVKLHRLFAELAIELRPVPAATGLCLADGRVFASQGKIAGSRAGALTRLREALRLARLLPALHRFRRRAGRAGADELAGRRLDDVLGDGVLDEWLRLLMVYAYSIPRDQVGAMPAALTIPTLHAFTGDVSWTSVVGGI
ncbi:MAG: NAD(P)-binding protein, partial [Myxococcales bacterium]|nr:NAD(P)-binding protein [Myxococcales bacterium]